MSNFMEIVPVSSRVVPCRQMDRSNEVNSFRFLWPCIVKVRWRERTNKMQLIRWLLSNFLSQHVSGIIMPIIRRIRPCPTACGVLPGCVGCGWLWSCGAASCTMMDPLRPETVLYKAPWWWILCDQKQYCIRLPDDGSSVTRNSTV